MPHLENAKIKSAPATAGGAITRTHPPRKGGQGGPTGGKKYGRQAILPKGSDPPAWGPHTQPPKGGA